MIKTLLAASLFAAAAQAEPLALVVDKSNPRSEISIDEVRNIYLGKLREWSDGTRVVPLDLPAGTAERDQFNDAALGMDQERIERFWVDQKVRGIAGAPRVAPAPAAAVKLAAKVR